MNALPDSIFNAEAEEAVLGAVLINPNAYLNIAAFLKADDFFLLRNNYIWKAIATLHERREPVDHITVSQELQAMNILKEIGGTAYLMQLMSNTPTSVHAEVYGRIVERLAIRRRLVVAADEIRALATNEEITIEQVASEAEAKLFTVTDRQTRRDFTTMHDAVNEYFDRIEHMMHNEHVQMGVPSGFRDLDALLGGFQRSDLLIFAGRPGMGKCVAQGTLVATEDGLIPIEELKPDGRGIPDDEGGTYYPLAVGVQTPDGIKPTAYFYDSGVKQTVRITTRLGYELTGTNNHPVLTLSKTGEKVWKPLSQVVPGDFVAVQRDNAVFGKTTRIETLKFNYYYAGMTKTPDLCKVMSPDLAYFMGLIAGDGGLTEKNYVSFSSADDEIIEAFLAGAKMLGLEAPQRSRYDYRISSVVLNSWLAHLGLSGYAHEKKVPQTILSAPKRCIVAFLQGLFDTDGHAESQSGYIQFATSSPELSKTLHILLLQFGILSKRTFKPNQHRGCWHLRITGDNARRFYDEIGFRLGRKQSRRALLPKDSNTNLDVIPFLPKRESSFTRDKNFTRYFRGKQSPSYAVLREIAQDAPEVRHLIEPAFFWDKVISQADAGLQPCYDLTVPDGQTFVTNGIVSHNTSFMLSTAVNMARLGARVAFFTMEMGVDQLVQRMVSMETGIGTQNLRLGKLNAQEFTRFVEAAGRISRFPLYIDDTPALNPIQVRTKARRLKHEFGIDAIFVDYLQLMNAGGQYQNNRVQEVSYISRAMKELARELNVPVFSAAQLSRAVEQRQDKRPVLSDLRESGSIEQDADIVMFLYRDAVYNEATEFPNQADIIVAKHRNGPTGVVSLYFEQSLTKFIDGVTRRVDLGDL